MKLLIGLILAALGAFGLKKILGKGSGGDNVREHADRLARERRKLEAKKKEMPDLKYEQRKQSLEEEETRLREKAKKSKEVPVPDDELEDMDANQLTERLNRYTG